MLCSFRSLRVSGAVFAEFWSVVEALLETTMPAVLTSFHYLRSVLGGSGALITPINRIRSCPHYYPFTKPP